MIRHNPLLWFWLQSLKLLQPSSLRIKIILLVKRHFRIWLVQVCLRSWNLLFSGRLDQPDSLQIRDLCLRNIWTCGFSFTRFCLRIFERAFWSLRICYFWGWVVDQLGAERAETHLRDWFLGFWRWGFLKALSEFFLRLPRWMVFGRWICFEVDIRFFENVDFIG